MHPYSHPLSIPAHINYGSLIAQQPINILLVFEDGILHSVRSFLFSGCSRNEMGEYALPQHFFQLVTEEKVAFPEAEAEKEPTLAKHLRFVSVVYGLPMLQKAGMARCQNPSK